MALHNRSLDGLTAPVLGAQHQKDGRLAPIGSPRRPASMMGSPYMEEQQRVHKRNKALELAVKRMGLDLAQLREEAEARNEVNAPCRPSGHTAPPP